MSWKVIPPTGGSKTVTAVFDGRLSAEDGRASAAAFRAVFVGTPLAVVWDVTAMQGFDGGARTAWAEAVWPIRDQIGSLKIIGARGLVRVGATFLALLLGRPYEFVSTAEPDQQDRAS
jgi:hypothetical protein